jgi:hypothetical protein
MISLYDKPSINPTLILDDDLEELVVIIKFKHPRREMLPCDCCHERYKGLKLRIIEDRTINICKKCLKIWSRFAKYGGSEK